MKDIILKEREDRHSGIELLKVIGIFFIVIWHMIQTLSSTNNYISYQEYVLDISKATKDIQCILLAILAHFGEVGNALFFICSAWFLIDSKKINGKKWFFMLIEVWVISILILLVSYVARNGNINFSLIIKSVLPITLNSNWYITAYLLFYPIHTYLNNIIFKMSKKELLRVVIILSVLYMGFGFLKRDIFFISVLILWITIYFLVAYFKLFLKEFCANKKNNGILCSICVVCGVGLIIFTNILGCHIDFFSDKLLYWRTKNNPFIIFGAIAAFNLFSQLKIKSRLINYVSKLSLLIYIIHENIIIRIYCRPYLVNYIYAKLGYDYILINILFLSLCIFAFTFIISTIYDVFFRKYVKKISELLYRIVGAAWRNLERHLLKYN